MRGFLSDISLSGCYLETLMPEPVGTQVEILFQVNATRLRLPGVVRVVHPSMGMGIQFLELTADVLQALQGLLKAQAAGAS
jgi:hypothetical protein